MASRRGKLGVHLDGMPVSECVGEHLENWLAIHAARLDDHSSPLAAFSKPQFQAQE